MSEKIVKIVKNKKILLILFLLASISFAIPSILYYFKNKTILYFDEYFSFLLNNTDIVMQAIIYIIILTILTILYFLIIKNRQKKFKNTKQIFIFIAIISLIFAIVIPFFSSDIFYYLGIGRLDSKYGQNPYYVTIEDYVEQNDINTDTDTVLRKGYENYWADTTVIYGPIWTIICKIISGITFGNIDIAIFTFKLVNILIHLLNCYLIYKLTNKKIFIIIYGLNPYMFIEGIANVHNDIYVVLFILTSLYFLLKKKKLILSLLFLAIATSIKYFAILLLPFVIIYHFRNEKRLKRFINCIFYGILFILMLLIPYLIYTQDIQVLNGIAVQQEKFSKSFYIILIQLFNMDIADLTQVILLIGFIIVYVFICLQLLCKEKINYIKEIRKIEYLLLAFIFLLLTNFQTWYIMWLFPLIIWQKPKTIKLIIQISLISQFANSIFMIYGEAWKNGTKFIISMLIGTIICLIYNNKSKLEKRREKV